MMNDEVIQVSVRMNHGYSTAMQKHERKAKYAKLDYSKEKGRSYYPTLASESHTTCQPHFSALPPLTRREEPPPGSIR
jgi:hypothetical protein